jgi:antitoxin component YwqK of YwqJK toxin-antitoxin module
MKQFFLIFAFLSFSISAYTPSKWSHTDRIVILHSSDIPKPIKEDVYDSNQKLILTSQFKYESEKLVGESYFSNGKLEGKTIYQYNPEGYLIKEITKDLKGKVTESKIFLYKKKSLSNIKIYTEDGKLFQDTKISKMEDEFIQSGEILWVVSKDKERLRMSNKDDQKILSIMDENNKPIGTVEFHFDKDKKLISRLFIQGNIERKNEFVYDSKGKLVEFTFHVKQEGKWVLEKTHKLSY